MLRRVAGVSGPPADVKTETQKPHNCHNIEYGLNRSPSSAGD